MLTEDTEREKSCYSVMYSIVTVQPEPFINTFNVLKGFKCFKILILLTV